MHTTRRLQHCLSARSAGRPPLAETVGNAAFASATCHQTPEAMNGLVYSRCCRDSTDCGRRNRSPSAACASSLVEACQSAQHRQRGPAQPATLTLQSVGSSVVPAMYKHLPSAPCSHENRFLLMTRMPQTHSTLWTAPRASSASMSALYASARSYDPASNAVCCMLMMPRQ